MGIKNFFKNAFNDMKADAKAQHEVDKANFEAVKAESKANFEENRGRRTYARAKAQSKKTWDEAHISPTKRREKINMERNNQIKIANERTEKAKERLENLDK